MKHKKCAGKLVLDCSSMYLIQSPSIQISTRGISPGVIQIDVAKNTPSIKLVCSQCQETFSNKDEYENGIVETCYICKREYPPSEIKVTERIGNVCIKCLSPDKVSDVDKNSMRGKIMAYYGEALKDKDFPTLLTVIMKK